MFKSHETPEEKAKKFIQNAKDAFKNEIPRDTINDIKVTGCTEKDGVFELVGAVGTTSPTGKSKTFRFTAAVKVEENAAALNSLQVSEL